MSSHLALLAGIALTSALTGAVVTQAVQPARAIERTGRTLEDRECLARAMYFESNKSAEDGMLAVGTVVANRLKSGRYGGSVCGVVGQHRQFAPGVLSRRMEGKAAERARRVAEAVIEGGRHPAVGDAMFFHTAGLRFGYSNMHYLAVAGGNIFYEKRSARSAGAVRANAVSMARAYAAEKSHQASARPVLLAAASAPAPKTAPAYAAEAAFGPVIMPADRFSLASAYRGNEAPAPDGALAAVAALAPKSKRVVVPTAPAQASVFPSRDAASTAKDARANGIVAQAWAAIAAITQ